MILPSLALPIPPVCDTEPELPICLLPGPTGNLLETTRCVLHAMGDCNPPAWYARGGKVVSASEQADGSVNWTEVEATGARVDIEHFVSVQSCKEVRGEFQFRPATMLERDARSILNSGEVARILPTLKQVQKFPYLRETNDRLVLETHGFNRGSGIYLVGDCRPEEVSLEEAVEALLELFSEFQFATEADRSRAIASVLTPALQGSSAISGSVPVTIVEANQSQAGKGLFVQTACALYDETPHIVVQRKGGVGSTDESLATNFLRGGAFVVFDNIRGSLKSEYLESALTANSSFPVRVPGKQEVLVDVSHATIWLTSNGFVSTVDLANRASFVQIRKPSNHQYRALPQLVSERKAFYQGCVLRVVRSFLEGGCPRTDEGRHSFHGWAQPLDWIVQNFFRLPPLLEGHESAQNTISNPNLAFLRALAHAVVQSGRLGEDLRPNVLADICLERDVPIVEGRDNSALELGVGGRSIGRKLSPVFRDQDSVLIDGYEVVRRTITDHSENGNPFEA
ncbi:MAG: hypothetical protein AAF491_05555, partial [Verrucomicrobiota bacterium]